MKQKHRVKKIIIDIGLALLLIGIFLLHFYIMPRKEAGEGKVLGDSETGAVTFKLPSGTLTEYEESKSGPADEKETGAEQNGTRGSSDRPARSEGDQKKRQGSPGSQSEKGGRSGGGNPGSGNTGTTEIESDNTDFITRTEAKAETLLHTLSEEDIYLTITKTELGEGSSQITYYTADIYLTGVKQLQTAFAKGTYGKNMRETTQQMAVDNQALLAISGDSYGNNEKGVVVRNGVLCRSETNDAEICVLFTDGTMKVYEPEELTQEGVLEQDVWQAWNFGPSLLDNGSVKSTFQTTSYLNRTNPRCAIGYVEPGHYLFVLVDGRDQGYSKGATMTELAQIMADEGCTLAYNLDGGKSSAMVYQGEYVNRPADGGRTISDIIYLERTE